jgi:peptidoglycan/LPS O-acetylase OafA/YrhL
MQNSTNTDLSKPAEKISFNNFFSEIKVIPPVLQNSYYPSLDGLRGIAIMLVVFSHLNLSSRLTTNSFFNIIFNGRLGVLIFFVLSGFLITTLCIKEKVTTNNISLKDFYIRRALRIFPVAYLYILVIIVLNYVFKLNISYINILAAVFYLMNLSSIFRKYFFSWETAHFWSLSVEEQFYLIIPVILKKRFKTYLLVILFIIFILPILISLQYLFPILNNNILYAFTHYIEKFQAIAIGCLFSVLTFKYSDNYKISNTVKVITNIAAFAFIFYMQYDDFFTLTNVFSGLIISFTIGYIIITNISFRTDIIFKILNFKILKIVGILSYSIYIWQQIFTSESKKLPSIITTFPYSLIFIVIVSCISYYFYESFFLRLKSKYSKLKKQKMTASHSLKIEGVNQAVNIKEL